MAIRLCALIFFIFLLATLRSFSADTTYVRFTTNFGYIDVQLLSDETPNTVTNFLQNVDAGIYSGVVIQRNVPGFIFQGGRYNLVGNSLGVNFPPSATDTLLSEAGVPNTRGTLAMALGADQTTGLTDPNSGNNQWFFNLGDNSSDIPNNPNNLDIQGFTVFGRIANANSLAVMDQIAAAPTFDQSTFFTNFFTSQYGAQTAAALGNDFHTIPLLNYSTGNPGPANLIIGGITRLIVQNFSNWQTAKFTVPQQSDPVFIAPATVNFNDGIPNMMKYLCNIDPSRPMTATDRLALPKVGLTTINNVKAMTLTFRQYAQKIDVSYTAQTSPDLVNWTTLPPSSIVPTNTTDSITHDPFMQVQVAAPAAGSKLFIRLKVSQP